MFTTHLSLNLPLVVLGFASKVLLLLYPKLTKVIGNYRYTANAKKYDFEGVARASERIN